MTKQIAEIEEIKKMAAIIADAIKPEKIYLFGSFAKGTQNEDSDYDFYVIVDNKQEGKNWELLDTAQKAIGWQRTRDLDIIIVTTNYYQYHLKNLWPLEQTVYKEGVLIYERSLQKMA